MNSNGIKTVRIIGGRKGIFAAVNDKGQFGFLPEFNTPYTPNGGRKALKLVVGSLQFRYYDWKEYIVGKAVKL